MRQPRGEATAMGTLIMFLIFLIILGALWLYSGGPERADGQGPFLVPPWLWGTGGGSYTVPGIQNIGEGTGSSGGSGAGTSEPQPTEETPSFFDTFFGFRGTSEKLDSPYAGLVALERGTATASNPDSEYVIIKTAYSLDRSITISDWTLEEDANTLSVKIGQASEAPFLGQVNVGTPITLPANSRVYVITGRSPNGFSFRLNQCTGYFEQFQNFYPSLPLECPDPEDELVRRSEVFSGNAACINYVKQLPRCYLSVNNLPQEIGNLCQSFVTNELSYNGCLNAHKNEPGFYKNEWRVFLNRDQEIWVNQYERIRLLDENGKTVSVISY
jgi:hypothetical protein